jgi:hypothetical protein
VGNKEIEDSRFKIQDCADDKMQTHSDGQGILNFEFDNFESKNSPVTCFGMEFLNDEARRAYFLHKLREFLADPEFRKIEGFPIGEDEDIMALSDPPYYNSLPGSVRHHKVVVQCVRHVHKVLVVIVSRFKDDRSAGWSVRQGTMLETFELFRNHLLSDVERFFDFSHGIWFLNWPSPAGGFKDHASGLRAGALKYRRSQREQEGWKTLHLISRFSFS